MSYSNKFIPLSPETIARARDIDLLTYLRTCEPDNLIRVSSSVYCTREHDSLKLSNGKWYWWSRGFGGKSALDYLIQVREMRFADAVQHLTGQPLARASPAGTSQKEQPKKLLLPPRNTDSMQAIRYLSSRGIDKNLIQACIQQGILYESADYHSVVFIGKDRAGETRFAACRSTMTSFKGDASGSDKRYSFRIPAVFPCNSVRLFESAIDLLSYAAWMLLRKQDYRTENLLSLSGVYQAKKEPKESKIPVALTQFLKENPHITTIFLHLDNDRAGRQSTAALMEQLKTSYQVVDEPPPQGKDFNDFLLFYRKNRTKPTQRKGGDAR